MTSTQVLKRNEEARQQRSQRQLEHARQNVEKHAHLADDYQREGHDVAGRLQEVEDNNPEFYDVSMARAMAYCCISLLFVCAYMFDIILFYPTAMFIAEATFGDNRPLVTATSLVIPALVLTAEISVSSHRHLAREERRRGAYIGATLLALIMLVVMPAMVISTHPYMRHLEDGSVEGNMLRWQAVSFVALVLVTHGLILFGGQAGHRAKSYVAFALLRRRLRRAARRNEEGHIAETRAAVSDFARYRQLLEADNPGLTEPAQAAAFDETTRGVLGGHFGYKASVNTDSALPHDGAKNGTRPHAAAAGSNNGFGHRNGHDDTSPPSPDSAASSGVYPTAPSSLAKP